MHSKFIILGSGISGISTAYFLNKAGYESIILDINNPLHGPGSTIRSAGIISHFFPFAEEIRIVQNSLRFYEDLLHSSSEKISYNKSGLLAIYTKSDEQRLSDFTTAMTSANVNYRYLDKPELKKLYPMISISSDELAIISEDSGYFDINHLFNIIFNYIQTQNIRIFTGVQIKKVQNNGSFLFHTNHGDFTSDKVIIAGGAWSDNIANLFNCNIKFDTYYTQAAILSISQQFHKYISSLPILYRLNNGLYGRPFSSSSFLFGDGTTKYLDNPNNFKFRTDESFHKDILNQATKLFPHKSINSIQRSWSGLYTSSQDSRPIIGELNDDLFFLGCFNGLGIMLAPGCSQLLVDYILKNKLPDDYFSFNIERFNNKNI